MSGHETLGDAWVAIRGDGGKFPSDIKGVVEKGLGDVAKKGAEILGGMFVGAKFAQAAKAGLDELKESVAVTAQVESAIQSTGGAAGVSAEHIKELAEAGLELSGTDDEIIAKGATLLLSFQAIRNEVGKGNDIFDRATEAGLDLASRGFGSVEGNAKLLGIALTDPEKGLTRLRRAGVVLTDQQIASIKGFQATGDKLDAQKVLLDAVEAKVGGAAAAYGETLPGKLAIAHESLKNTEAQLVSGAAPALELFAGWVTAATSAVSALPGPLQTVISVVATAGVGFVAIARPLGAVIQLYDRFLGASKAAGAAAEIEAAEVVAAEEAKTVATVESSAAMSAADIANLKRVASNEGVTFSDAEVAAALEARTLAEYQALIGNDALIAADAELVAANQALAASALEVAAAAEIQAAAEEAAGAASLGALGVGALLVAGAAIAIGVFSALSDTFGSNEKATKDYTTALEANTGALQENVDKVTATELAHNDAAVAANKAGISYASMFEAVRTGTDDWGELGRQLDSVNEGVDQSADVIKKNLVAALKAGGAESTEFGKSLIAQAEAGTLSASTAKGLVNELEGLHNGYTKGKAAADEEAKATAGIADAADTAQPSIDELRANVDTLTDAEKELVKVADEAAAAHAAFPEFVSSLAGAMDKTYQSLVAGTQATSTYEKSINALEDSLKKNGATLDVVVDKTGRYSEKALANQDAVLAVGASISKLIEARFEETHSTEDAIAVGQLYVDNLTNQLTAAGYNKDQIAQMIAVMHLTPEDINTTFSNNAIEQQIVVGKYLASIKDIPENRQTEIEALIDQGRLDEANALLNALAHNRSVDIFVAFHGGQIDIAELGHAANVEFHASGQASGGPVYAGEMYRVNEVGREYFQPAVDGTILSADRVERALSVSARGGTSDMSPASLTIQVTVDARGATPETARAVGENFGDGLAATLVKRRLAVTAATGGTR